MPGVNPKGPEENPFAVVARPPSPVPDGRLRRPGGGPIGRPAGLPPLPRDLKDDLGRDPVQKPAAPVEAQAALEYVYGDLVDSTKVFVMLTAYNHDGYYVVGDVGSPGGGWPARGTRRSSTPSSSRAVSFPRMTGRTSGSIVRRGARRRRGPTPSTTTRSSGARRRRTCRSSRATGSSSAARRTSPRSDPGARDRVSSGAGQGRVVAIEPSRASVEGGGAANGAGDSL